MAILKVARMGHPVLRRVADAVSPDEIGTDPIQRLIDDMIDTGGTICAAAELLDEYNAKRIIIATTHGVFSGPAIDRIKNAPVETVLVTDTLPLPSEKRADKITVLSVAPIIAQAISAVFEDTSVSEIFGGNHLA